MKLNKKALAGAGLGAVVLVGGTFAYYNQTLSIDNPLKSSKYGTELVEEFTPSEELKPGATIKKEVGVTNTGDYPVLVRIRMDEKWSRLNAQGTLDTFGVHGSGDIDFNFTGLTATQVPTEAGGTDGDTNGLTFVGEDKDGTVVRKDLIEGVDGKWLKGSDGYWYYRSILQKDGTTGNLLKSLTFATNMDMGLYNVKDYYYAGKTGLVKENIGTDAVGYESTAWIPYEITKENEVVTKIESAVFSLDSTDADNDGFADGDKNKDGIIDAIDMAIVLGVDPTSKDESVPKSLYRKNVSTLDDQKKGYADANYTLTVKTQVVQATEDAVTEAFKDKTTNEVPADVQALINSLKSGFTK